MKKETLGIEIIEIVKATFKIKDNSILMPSRVIEESVNCQISNKEETMKLHDITIDNKTGTVLIDDKELQGVAEKGVKITIDEEKHIREITIKFVGFNSFKIIGDYRLCYSSKED